MSLQVWLPLNGNLDNQGVSDLTFSIINSTYTTISTSGKIGSCYSNSSNSAGGLISDKTISLGSNQSMFCWVKFNSFYASSNLTGIGGQHRYSSNCGMGLTAKYLSDTTGKLSVNTGDGSSRTYNTYCGNTTLNSGTWYHVGYTYDGSTIKLYVNGTLDGTFSYSGMSVPADYLHLFTWSLRGTSGSSIHAGYQLNGYINDFRAYDEVISDKQIRELANCLICHYPLDGKDTGGHPNLLAATNYLTTNSVGATLSNYTVSFTKAAAYSGIAPNTTVTNTENTTYTLSYKFKKTAGTLENIGGHTGSNVTFNSWYIDGIQQPNSYSGSASMSDNTNIHKVVLVFTTTGTDTLTYIQPNRGSSTSVTVDVWDLKIEKGSIATYWTPNSADALYSTLGYSESKAKDVSGYGYDAVLVGDVRCESDSPRYVAHSYGVSTNIGTSTSTGAAYIKGTMSTAISPTELTISWWGNMEDWSYQSSEILSLSTNATSPTDYQTSTLNQYDGKFQLNSASASTSVSAATLVINNAWHHYVIKYDGTNITSYRDNSLIQTTALTGTLKPFQYIYIGLSAAGGAWRQSSGRWSDFRIYATALSADDIKTLYERSISIANNGSLMTQGEIAEE